MEQTPTQMAETPAQRMKRLTHAFIEELNCCFEKRMESIYKDILWLIEVSTLYKNSDYFSLEISIQNIIKRNCLKEINAFEIEYLTAKLRKDGFGVEIMKVDGQISGIDVEW